MSTGREKELLFKAVGNRRRLAVIAYLRGGKRSAGEIARHLKLSVGATSRHLSLLANAGIVDSVQEGLLVYYFLAPQPSATVRRLLAIC